MSERSYHQQADPLVWRLVRQWKKADCFHYQLAGEIVVEFACHWSVVVLDLRKLFPHQVEKQQWMVELQWMMVAVLYPSQLHSAEIMGYPVVLQIL